MYTQWIIVVVALLLGGYGFRQIRKAGEDITAEKERHAYDALVKRQQEHSAEQARKQAFKDIGPYLRRELKDHRNPTRPGSKA